jgi:hypothetical protein
MTSDPVLDTLHVTDAIAAGANVFFPMPAATPEMIGAIEQCLLNRGPETTSPHPLRTE